MNDGTETFRCVHCREVFGTAARHYRFEDYCFGCGGDRFQCVDCDDVTHNDYRTHVWGRGDVCEYCAVDWYNCEGCGAALHSESYSIYFTDYGDAFCESCYEENSSQPSEDLRRCAACNTTDLWLDTDTEQFLCECKAQAAANDGHLVMHPDDKPVLTVPDELPLPTAA